MELKSYFSRLRSVDLEQIHDVEYALHTLNDELGQTERLACLQNFNKAYLIITQHVGQALTEGNFEHPDFLHTFDTRFALYYFNALEAYISGNEPPKAWRTAFETCARKNAKPIIYMALGVNAHINNDIPQVLRDCAANPKHLHDYILVNEIIKESIYEVIDSLEPDHSLIGPKRVFVKPAYKMTMDMLVRKWRQNAWHNFEDLSLHNLDVQALESQAHALSRRILALPI